MKELEAVHGAGTAGRATVTWTQQEAQRGTVRVRKIDLCIDLVSMRLRREATVDAQMQ